MTRARVLGDAFAEAVALLGLEPVEERPDVVLVDLRLPDAVACAAAIPSDVPRIVVGDPEQRALLRAAGCAVAFAEVTEPAALGPSIRAVAPERDRGPTRLVVVTGVRGGIGRTLLVVGLARRLAVRLDVLVVDATGSGAAAWWLGVDAAPWSELEGLADELSAEHLATVAAERERVRVVGGAPSMPSLALTRALARTATDVARCVLVDAPPVFDERARMLMAAADRVLLLAPDEPAALPLLEDALHERTWLIASRSRERRIGDHAAFRSLPDDPAVLRGAERGSAIGGRLGQAYDDLAELLLIDAT